MTAKWKEVSAYTGQPVEEDAPTNFAGKGSGVAMPPDAMMKKKKKRYVHLQNLSNQNSKVTKFPQHIISLHRRLEVITELISHNLPLAD